MVLEVETSARSGGQRRRLEKHLQRTFALGPVEKLLTICQFVEYDPRAHRLDTLATFAFWVQSKE